MKAVIKATDASYRQAIGDERNDGRLPLAWLTVGYVSGYGWGFLHPWAQVALFPAKGTNAGVGPPARHHERFLLLRILWRWENRRHRNHEHPIAGRYWRGFAWRRSWGWRPRWVVLDPDIVSNDPHREDFDTWFGRLGHDQ